MSDPKDSAPSFFPHGELLDTDMQGLAFAGEILSSIAVNLLTKGLPRYNMDRTHESYRQQLHQALLRSEASISAFAENEPVDDGIDLAFTSGVLLELADHLDRHGRVRINLNHFAITEAAQQPAFADRLQSVGSQLVGMVALQREELSYSTSDISE